MTKNHTISLPAFDGTKIMAEVVRGEGRELAIILPGLRYGCERPLLNSMAQIFIDRGCDVVLLQFDYAEDTGFLNAPDVERFARIATDGANIFAGCIELGNFEKTWLVGKSLGTLSMGAPLQSNTFMTDDVYSIWLTPSLLETPLLAQMLSTNCPSLVILGTNDPSNRSELIEPLKSLPLMSVHLVDGVDHGFDHEDGPDATNEALMQAADIVRSWIRSLSQ